MKILLLNQAFHPDVVATGQYATDLALRLNACGHQVTVVGSRYGYDDPRREFPRREVWRGISIHRISLLRLDKSSRWRRALSFASFSANCFVRVALLSGQDVVVALTSPPLICALGAALVRLKGGRFIFWVMDLNPDEAIAAGWLDPRSRMSRVLQAVLRFSIDNADRLVALDRFMADRLVAKGACPDKIAVIPPWSLDDSVFYDKLGREAFRREHGLDRKFVVMYAGNHSPCHPLDTLLEVAQSLRGRKEIVFCFVGGGSEFRKIQEFTRTRQLANVQCIPYQPIEKLSAVLSSADLHIVAMGNPFVGIVHPCKVYNIRSLGIPFAYIGPSPSHVTELGPAASFRHGNVPDLAAYIADSSAKSATENAPAPAHGAEAFSRESLLTKMLDVIERGVIPGSAPRPAISPEGSLARASEV